MTERWTWNIDGREVAASTPFDAVAVIAGQLSKALPGVPVYDGVVVDESDGLERLAQGMVESMTEFDFSPGLHSIPDRLRERLLEWCADLRAWDRATRRNTDRGA